jgi:hypothetical protein
VASTGSLAVHSKSASFSEAFNTTQWNFASNLGGLNLGKTTNNQNIIFDSAVSIGGPITAYGGNINISADLAVSTANPLKIMASKDIVGSMGTDLSTQGGNILLASNTDNTDGGGILMTGATIKSYGGNITLGGGNLDGSSYAEGSSFGGDWQRYRGMWLEQTTIDASGSSSNGNIEMRGKGWQGANWVSSQASDHAIGIDIVTNTVIKTGGTGTIEIDGNGGKNYRSDSHGVGINFYNSPQISSNAGSITISGTAGPLGFSGEAAREHAGILLDGGNAPSIYSTSGAITLAGNGSSTDDGIKFKAGFNLGWDGASAVSSGDINLIADAMSFAAGFNVKTTGKLAVESVSNSFRSALNWPLTNFTIGNTLGGLQLGKSSNTANITIGSAQTVSGPITIYGGDLALSAALTATGSNINLHASGAITQSAALTANGLGLHGPGTFTLDNTSNAIETLAGGTSSAKIGNLNLFNSKAFTIGTITNPGIHSSGTVELATSTGDISINQPIVSTAVSGDVVKIYPSKALLAGDVTGGNIKFTSPGTVTIESGARALLYSATKTASTGLETLVGSTNIRYQVGSTTALTAINPTLGTSGKFALFRENPVYNISIVASGGSPKGTGWNVVNGVLTVTASASINASDLQTELAAAALLIQTNGKISIDGALTIAGTNRLTLDAAIIEANEALSSGGELVFKASTSITQSSTGNISAPKLALTGSGSTVLTNTGNIIGSVAGGSGAVPTGALSLVNNGALTVGVVNPTGITSSGLIELETLSGDLLITEPIVSTLANGDAVRLYADKDAAKGAAGDGNIKISGNGIVTIESGARALMYSGSAALSTGLSDLVTEANTRNNVDATTAEAMITPAIGTNGKYALYREASLADLGGITIVSSGGVAENSGWSYVNGTIQASSNTAVSINASAIVAKLALGNLTVQGSSVTMGTSADVTSSTNKNLTLKSTSAIVFNAGSKISSQGGSVVLWADADGNGAGDIFLESGTSGSISTNGGHLWLGGGSGSTTWNGLTVGDGFAVGDAARSVSGGTFYNGITINATSISTAGGHIKMNGKGKAGDLTANVQIYSGGMYLIGTGSMNSGGGNIDIEANAQSGSGQHYGFYNLGAYNFAPGSGDLTIKGDASASSSGNYNVTGGGVLCGLLFHPLHQVVTLR